MSIPYGWIWFISSFSPFFSLIAWGLDESQAPLRKFHFIIFLVCESMEARSIHSNGGHQDILDLDIHFVFVCND